MFLCMSYTNLREFESVLFCFVCVLYILYMVTLSSEQVEL